MPTIVDTLSILWVLVLVAALPSSAREYGMAKPKCKETCENSDVRIPYPFGIGKNCYDSSSEHYEIICKPPKSSASGAFKPFLRKFDIQVIGMNFVLDDDYNNNNFDSAGYNSLEVAASDTQEYCTSGKGKSSSGGHQINDLTGTPFTFSYYSKFSVQGCPGHVKVSDRNGTMIGGCAVMCEDNHAVKMVNHSFISPDDCHGLGCCSISPRRDQFEYYEISLSHLSNVSVPYNTCINVSFFWDDDKISGLRYASWMWKGPPISKANNPHSYGCFEPGPHCRCQYGYSGNPYLPFGCQATKVATKRESVITGLGISLGSITFLLCGYGLFHVIRRWIQIKRKAKFFKRNGGLLLQQEVTASDTKVDNTKVFSVDELDKATDIASMLTEYLVEEVKVQSTKACYLMEE